MRSALDEFRTLYSEDSAATEHLTQAFLPSTSESERRVELAAWTMLVHSLLNLDVTKTRQ